MSDDLKIIFDKKGNKTVSKFAVGKVKKVIFDNTRNTDPADILTVNFIPPLNNLSSITVQPGKAETCKVDRHNLREEIKYTATLGKCLPEDPILIID